MSATTGPARGPGDAFAAGCRSLGPRLMRDLGLTDLQAAGLLGNLGHESGGFRQLQEIAPAVAGLPGRLGPRAVDRPPARGHGGLVPGARASIRPPPRPSTATSARSCAPPRRRRSRPCGRLATLEAATESGVPALRAARRRRAGEPARLGRAGRSPPCALPPRRSPGQPPGRAEPPPFPSRPGPPRAQLRRSIMTHRLPCRAGPCLRRPPVRRPAVAGARRRRGVCPAGGVACPGATGWSGCSSRSRPSSCRSPPRP